MSARRLPSRRRARGFSLVELMISLVIGMVVIGAVFAAYLSAGFSSRNTQAMSQMTEDASVALNLLRSHLTMVGYSRPTALTGSGFTRIYEGMGLTGCRGRFTNLAATTIDALTCPGAGAGGTGDSVALAYEVDTRNDVVGGAGNTPLDCVGNGLTAITNNGNTYYLSYSRFYLDTPTGSTATALYCRGPGSDTPQALVENIIDMRLSYGVAAADAADANRRVAYYAPAGSLTAADFNRVMAVKVCVVAASASEVMDIATPYRPCDPFGAEVTPTDRRMYRAFTTTIVMHNRMGVLQTPVAP